MKRFYEGLKRWRSPLLLVAISLFTFAEAAAFNLETGISCGYDDNLLLTKGGPGAFFNQAEIDFRWNRSLSGATTLTLSAFADYCDYHGEDDRYQLGLGLESASRLQALPLSLEFFSLVNNRRNPLIPDNDFDALNLGGRLVWPFDLRLDLIFACELSWEKYCADYVTDGFHRKLSLGSGPTANQTRQARGDLSPGRGEPGSSRHNNGERSDRLTTIRFESAYAVNPYLELGGGIFYQQRHSSIDLESRTTSGLNLSLDRRITPTLSLNAAGGGERSSYKYDYQQKERREKNYFFTLGAAWRQGPWTISGSWSRLQRNSDLEEDNFRANQWQGRLSYSF
ncbi:MAG TPA: autotransporter domain-containing protein [Proteobacteria bacterium]|nr:autotransporter domain-containing protein [Pseudomonadota bacterium]